MGINGEENLGEGYKGSICIPPRSPAAVMTAQIRVFDDTRGSRQLTCILHSAYREGSQPIRSPDQRKELPVGQMNTHDPHSIDLFALHTVLVRSPVYLGAGCLNIGDKPELTGRNLQLAAQNCNDVVTGIYIVSNSIGITILPPVVSRMGDIRFRNDRCLLH